LVRTGYTHTTNSFIQEAEAEVSYDGVNFEKVGELWYGDITIHPTKPIKAIRVVSTYDMPYPMTVIQPLIVK